jgi:hypothetical protein
LKRLALRPRSTAMTPKSAVLTETRRTSQALPRPSSTTIPFDPSGPGAWVRPTDSVTALGMSMSLRRSDLSSRVPRESNSRILRPTSVSRWRCMASKMPAGELVADKRCENA